MLQAVSLGSSSAGSQGQRDVVPKVVLRKDDEAVDGAETPSEPMADSVYLSPQALAAVAGSSG